MGIPQRHDVKAALTIASFQFPQGLETWVILWRV